MIRRVPTIDPLVRDRFADPVSRERFIDSESALRQLRREADDWIVARQKKDRHDQYVTQLQALRLQFKTIFDELDRQLSALSDSGNRRLFYGACRAVDTSIIWARRVFEWYRQKFDQRDDPALAPTLEAADEIVWSCYAQPFRAVDGTPPAVPLPFLEASYSPSAIPRVDPPQDLRSDVNAEFLRTVLNELPVPVVALPYACLDDPWWLAFIAHEVGHHVEFDLFSGDLQKAFVAAVRGAGDDRWASWHEELFADLYSVLMIGPWASWALAELVWDVDRPMLDDTRVRYPAPLIRTQFMSAVATSIGIDATPAFRGLKPTELLTGDEVTIRGRNLRETAAEDSGRVGNIAKATLGSLTGVAQTLITLTGFDSAEFTGNKADVTLWSQALRGNANMSIRQDLRSARVVLAAAVRAWSEIAELSDDDQREQERERLKKATLETIVKSREEITRASVTLPASAVQDSGERVARMLLMDAPPIN
jgi:hypothetical protein